MPDGLTEAVDATILNSARRAVKDNDVKKLKTLKSKAIQKKTKDAIDLMIRAVE